MLSVLIVDDEAIVRSSIATMINWEQAGFCIAGSCPNGKAALNFLQEHPVDVIFTDIKMPIMGGIELIEKLNELKTLPVVVVLSAYNEFEMVRKAFRLGAHDYILKGDITEEYLADMLGSIRKQLGEKPGQKPPAAPEEMLLRMALGNMEAPPALLEGSWCLGCLEIDHFKTQSLRFGPNLSGSLIQPLLDFALQIPRVAAKCTLVNISLSRFVVLFSGVDAVAQARSIACQIQKVWKDYLNLSVSGGISQSGNHPEDFQGLLQECYSNVTLKYIFGFGGIFTPEEERLFSVKEAVKAQTKLMPLLKALCNLHGQQLLDSQQELFAQMHSGSVQQAKTLALNIVYNVEMQLLDTGTDFWQMFNTEVETDFYQKISCLASTQDVEVWTTGFLRWVADYLQSLQAASQVGPMEKAKAFIADNYTNPEMNLAAVAAFVGLNEKYLSSRFNKEVGTSFVNYLTDLRINRAKQMILKTDLKMYEISDAVGFSSVEHFTRVFKRITGISPGGYLNSH